MEEEKSNVDDAFTPSDSKEKKGGNKTLLGLVILILVIALIIGVAYFVMLKTQQTMAKKTVETVLESLKTGDKEMIDKYLNNAEGSIADQDDTFILFFKGLNYTTKKVEGDFKTASVEMEISNKDTGKIFQNYFAKAYQLALSNAFSGNYSEESLTNDLKTYLEEQVNSDEVETITNTITIRLEKSENEWKLVDDDENVNQFVDAVLPNFTQIVEQLSNSLNQ